MPLSAIAVKNAKANGRPYKMADFDGLYLYVSAQGSRLWRFDYRFAGKRKTASFGVFPDVSLVEAREKRDVARKLLKDGRDPVVARQFERARINGNAENTFAVAEGKATRDPSRDLEGALTTAPAVRHRNALSAAEPPAFFSKLDAYQGHEQVRLALELALLCFTRAEETCQAEWTEFEGLDGKAPLWRVPAARMKMKREHLIPLSPRAVEVLRRAKELAGESPKVFPIPNKYGVLMRFNLLRVLYAMGFKGEATTHGFRRTGSTILHEKGIRLTGSIWP